MLSSRLGTVRFHVNELAMSFDLVTHLFICGIGLWMLLRSWTAH